MIVQQLKSKNKNSQYFEGLQNPKNIQKNLFQQLKMNKYYLKLG